MLPPRNQPLGGKITGAGGAQLTPQQVAEQQKIARALLMEAGDTSPVGHWTAALNRGLQGWLGGRDMFKAREGERTGREGALAKLAGRGGQNPVAQALAAGQAAAPGGGAAYTPPAEAAQIRAGLLERGLPEHIADGFLMNFQDESGLNPGINELNPLVPGSRGGFGLYQLTGPRRTAYEQFASQRGVDASDVEAQLDWLMHELQGPESRAASAIFNTSTPGEAGAAIVNEFLRPAAEHRNSRANRYLGGAAPSGSGSYAGPGAGNVSEIAALLADPWVAEVAGPQLQAEMQQQMQMQNAAYQQQLQQQDPMYQMQMQRAQLELDRARAPQRDAIRYEFAPNGEMVAINETQGSVQSMGNYAKPEASYTRISPEQAAQFGLDPNRQWQVGPDNKIEPIGGTPLVQNNLGGDKFADKVGEGQATAFLAMSEAGNAAAASLGQIDRLEGLLAQGPSGAPAALQSLAADYGIDFGNAGTLQGANALIQAMIPAQRPAGSGPMSDKDIEMFKASLPRLINSPEGNALILQTLRGIAQYDMQRAQIADRAMLPPNDPQHITRAEAARSIRELRSPLSEFGKSASGFAAPAEDPAAIPQGVDPEDWKYMSEEDKALFR